MRKEKFAIVLATVVLLAALSGIPVQVAGQETAGDEIHFTILHTNDEHSAFVPFLSAEADGQKVGGMAYLAAQVAEIRETKKTAGESVLLLSGGDFLGETSYGWLSTWGYAPEIEFLQLMGYDAVAIGNHEYDFGPDILADYLMRAGYPEAHTRTMILSANTVAPTEHPLASEGLYLTHGLLELDNGLKIGIFGLIGKDAISVTANSGDIEFRNQSETARQMVEKLRAQGADLVIALSHSGDEEDILLASEVDGIDIIVGGHSHTLLAEPVIVNETIIVQAGSQTRYLGQLELAYEPQSRELKIRNGDTNEPYIIPIGENIMPHPDFQERVEYYTDILNEKMTQMTDGKFSDVHAALINSPFVLSNRPGLQETAAGNFITDGMRLITEEITGHRVDIAVQANGSIRGSMIPRTGNSGRGELTFYDITNTIGLGYGQDGYPGYSVVSIYLTGEEIRRVLEIAALLPELMGDDYFLQFSGLRYEYDPRNTVLLTIPVIDQPIPSTRAVSRAQIYRGSGIQPEDKADESFILLKKGDAALYNLVTDTYILSFLPLAGEILPQLEVIPKNEQGQQVPADKFNQLTVKYAGRELKVWETVAMYAAKSGEIDTVMPDAYANVGSRIVPVKTFPLIIWLILFLLVILGAIITPIIIIRRFREMQKKII